MFLIPITGWGQTRGTNDELDFSFANIGSMGWSSSYDPHIVEFDNSTVTFTSASKQGSTISDIPVTKGQPVSVVLKESTNKQITAVNFVCRQWTTKAQTITLHYSTNGGTTYTSTGITSSNFTISSSSLPEGTNAVKITFSSTSNQVGVASCSYTFEEVSSGLQDNDLALTDAPINLSFDLYNNASEQVIHYTTSSTGEVSVVDNDYVSAEVDENNKTITVTPMAVTNGAQTITVIQEEDDTYASGSATFTVNITDSTPFTGGDVTFTAGTDLGSTTTNADGDEMTKLGVTVSSTCAAFATAEYRLYSGSTTTLSTSQGTITQIVFTKTGSYSLSNLSTTTGYDSSTGTWTGNANSIDFTASAQVRLSKIVVTVDMDSPTLPSITADDVEILYNATNGSIAYTVNNEPTPVGTMTAAIKTGTTPTITHLSFGTSANNAVSFTCDANTDGTARTATVTLTYTYDTDQTVTQDVTITQAADPNYVMTIAEAKAMTDGTTVRTSGLVTSVNGTTAYIEDATGAIVVYNSNVPQYGYNITVEGEITTYKGLREIGKSNNAPTVTLGAQGTVTPTVMTIEAINTDASGSNNHQAKLVRIDNATVSAIPSGGITIAQGNNTILVYGLTGYSVNDVLSLTANIGCYDNVQLVNATDVQVQQSTDPSVTVTPATVNAPAAGADGTLTVTYENITTIVAEVYFCDANGDAATYGDWIQAEINNDNNVYYVIGANDGAARTAYLKVYALDNNGGDVYSNLVTITQEEYVAPTYAELPFTFNGGKADIENTDGLYQDGLGTDYNASTNPNTQLKFDNTGDWLLLQFTERPGTLTFNIKGNSYSSGSTSTFKVQTSEDGTTFTDIATYTELGDTDTKTFENLDAGVRYIKWIYTEKGSTNGGNVGLGNISLAEYVAPVPAIAIDPESISLTAAATDYATASVSYENLDERAAEICLYETYENGVCSNKVTDIVNYWFAPSFATNNDELIEYTADANTGTARTVYMRVEALGGDYEMYYSNVVTVTQAAAPQQYNLTVEPFANLEIITFVGGDENNPALEGDGTIQVTEGVEVKLSVVAEDDYEIATLMVNGVDHVNDIAGDFTYTFTMPGEAVTISATAVEIVTPTGGDYVRITSLDQLTDGSVVVIAARYDEEHTNGYYAMSNATSGKPTGESFTSTTSGNNEILPASIVDNKDDYYWVVNETENGYTFTNAEGLMIGYNSGTNFATGGNNTEWTIERSTSKETAMVCEYTGFVIKNKNTDTRGFAFNGSAFGAYATSNMAGSGYNFFLDFFVQSEAPTPQNFTLDIAQYTSGDNGWYLIASPVAVDIESNTMVSGDYDLYRFNPTANKEWENYKNPEHSDFTTLEVGRGYLYANGDDGGIQLCFTGVPANEGDVTVTDAGWNLVGNPLSTAAIVDRDYYRMNDTHDGIMTDAGTGNIAVMEGVFVQTTQDDEIVAFTAVSRGTRSNDIESVTLNLMRNNYVIDRAIVRFNSDRQLGKLTLFDGDTKIYIPQGTEDYAIVSSNGQGEMPVNFLAAKDGQFTISVNPENVEMNYLHLIDNITGADVDLLANPSYTFNGSTMDYPSRFRLVFSAKSNDANVENDNFAFISNGQIILNGVNNDATIQVIDMLGRVVISRVGAQTIATAEMTSGVYVLRLLDGTNVMTQKIVVK